MNAESKSTLMDMFKEFDENNDGKITKEEFFKAYEEVGISDWAEKHYSEIDKDDKGWISPSEFCEFDMFKDM